MRAVTVPIAGASAVAGFVFPGDRVDLVLTQSVPGGGEGQPLKVSETVLRNLRVLATDQRTDNSADDDGKTVVKSFSSVTVEATPRLAEQLAVVQTLGTLSLSLRSLADNNEELEEAIASGDVKVPDSNDPDADKKMMAKIASMPRAGKSTYVTGGDVSRFQRSTVPGKPEDAQAGPVAPGAPVVGVVRGPVIRIARGNNVTEVPVGGKN
jgi:pilus assembly protein CpaB